MTCANGCCATQREHYLSVSVSAAATPTRRAATAEIIATESRWEQDMPAYKRLRKDGIQPSSIDGCAAIEREAQSKNEIETGVSEPVLKRIADAQARVLG